jgi:hypothetical protein
LELKEVGEEAVGLAAGLHSGEEIHQMGFGVVPAERHNDGGLAGEDGVDAAVFLEQLAEVLINGGTAEVDGAAEAEVESGVLVDHAALDLVGGLKRAP